MKKSEVGMTVKDTRAIGIRLPLDVIERIQERAAKRGISFNQWINWAINNGLRPHRRKDYNGSHHE